MPSQPRHAALNGYDQIDAIATAADKAPDNVCHYVSDLMFINIFRRYVPVWGRLADSLRHVGEMLDVDIITAEHPITDAKPHRIVIVDDDEAVRDSLGLLLSLAGFDAVSVESGLHLQDLLQHQQIDCLIIDVNMPGMCGLDLVNWLNDSSYEIPTILISARLCGSVETRARRAGVTQFLEKPFSDECLISAIRGLVN